MRAPQEKRGGWIHGKAVVDGEVQYLSVSALQLAELCMRRYVYAYVHGLKDPETESLRIGKEKHEEVDKYLETGSRAHLSARVLSGMHLIPEPGEDLLHEWDILVRPNMQLDFTRDNSKELLAQAPVRAAGIPLTGKIDCLHARGTNKGGTDIEDAYDPEGTVEVIDWKFVGSLQNAKTSQELLHSIQMLGYGKYVFAVMPDAKLVRLSHCSFPKKGRPKKSTILATPEQIHQGWEYVERLAGSIRDAVKQDIDTVDYNKSACTAFGRDCPAKSVCKAAEFDSLSEIIGSAQASEELELSPRKSSNMVAPGSLAAQLKAKKAAAAAKNAPSPAVKADMMKLAREEADKKYPGLIALLGEIEALGFGFPMLTGDLAKAKGLLSDPPYEVEGEGLIGAAELAEYSCGTLEELQDLLSAVKSELAGEGENVETSAEQKEEAATEAIQQQAEAPKKKGGKKKKSEDKPAEKPAEKAPIDQKFGEGESISTPDAKFYFYVDAVPSVPYQSFWPIVYRLMDYIAVQNNAVSKLSDGTEVATDPRLAPKDSKAGYGGWKALVSTYLKNYEIPTSGHWVLLGGYHEVAQEVAYAMQEICNANGGVFVRGTR